MEHSLLCMLGFFLLSSQNYGDAKAYIKPRVTLEPSRSQIFRGESVTLRCEIQDEGGTQWTYEWSKKNLNKSPTSREFRINSVSESDGGKYKCRGRTHHHKTKESDSFRLIVTAGKPRATLTSSETTSPAGGSVTLSCSVSDSTGWRFDWFRFGSVYHPSESESNRVRVSEGGVFSCRGGRGDPGFYTQTSNEVTIIQTVPNKPRVALEPSWSQIFRGESVTLRCEIQDEGGTQWTYEWRPTRLNKPPPSREIRITDATESDSGEYSCRGRSDYLLTQWSDVITLTVKPDKPRATLTSSGTTTPAGGSVTLSCSVSDSTGWRFDWFRLEFSKNQLIKYKEPNREIRVSEGGEFSCRGGRGDPGFYTQTSNKVNVTQTVPIKPSLTLDPSWSQIYGGESVTLRCEIQDEGGAQWTYEWRPTRLNKPPPSREIRITDVTESDSGEYSCRGRSDYYLSTQWSDVITLTVSAEAQSVLSVSPSWLSPGASVTLSCEVRPPSAGWRFSWFKAVPDPSGWSYNYNLLPGSSSGTEQNSFIIHGQKHSAGYVCRAGRGDPEFYSGYSEPEFVWSADSPPAASLSVSPDRVQHFRSDSITLTCEGNFTKWRVMRFIGTGGLTDVCDWRTKIGSSCIINSYWSDSGVFWCESGSEEFSSAVNITLWADSDGLILESPLHPVTEGDPVTLSCRRRDQKRPPDVFFYHNNKRLQHDGREELKISAVSKSDEGFYKCGRSGEESPESWMSVQVSESSPVRTVLLIVGPVFGLIVLLFLLWIYRRSKGDSSLYSQSNHMEPRKKGKLPEPEDAAEYVNLNRK